MNELLACCRMPSEYQKDLIRLLTAMSTKEVKLYMLFFTAIITIDFTPIQKIPLKFPLKLKKACQLNKWAQPNSGRIPWTLYLIQKKLWGSSASEPAYASTHWR